MGRREIFTARLAQTQVSEAVQIRMDILAYCDGQHSVLDISEMLSRPAWVLAPYFAELVEHDLIGEVDQR